MKERPILFSAPMVRAILEGRKTQTRRLVKHKHLTEETHARALQVGCRKAIDELSELPCPYGAVGDRLWVQESWAAGCCESPTEITCAPSAMNPRETALYYAACNYPQTQFKWRPSIHMPRWASRITLEVIGVRVERLQEISEIDAIAEGIEKNCSAARWIDGRWMIPPNNGCPRQSRYGCDLCSDEWMNYLDDEYGDPCLSAKEAFESLWDSINAARNEAYAWKANPWVWVVEFRKLTKEG